MEQKKDSRMLEINESLEQKHEVFKETKKVENKEELLKEGNRLRDLASGKLNADFNENYFVAGAYQTGGRGKTVNTILNDYQDTQVAKTPKPEPSNLKKDEALDVAIKRTLKSGAPVNNISFYDEVNWNLMNLGFPAVNDMDIKNTISSLMSE